MTIGAQNNERRGVSWCPGERTKPEYVRKQRGCKNISVRDTQQEAVGTSGYRETRPASAGAAGYWRTKPECDRKLRGSGNMSFGGRQLVGSPLLSPAPASEQCRQPGDQHDRDRIWVNGSRARCVPVFVINATYSAPSAPTPLPHKGRGESHSSVREPPRDRPPLAPPCAGEGPGVRGQAIGGRTDDWST